MDYDNYKIPLAQLYLLPVSCTFFLYFYFAVYFCHFGIYYCCWVSKLDYSFFKSKCFIIVILFTAELFCYICLIKMFWVLQLTVSFQWMFNTRMNLHIDSQLYTFLRRWNSFKPMRIYYKGFQPYIPWYLLTGRFEPGI